MWAEARKQERKIRGMLVDYRKRAERRQDFYEKIKADPTQFMQIHGRRCKIHLDPAVAAAGESPAIMMPWQGQADNLIDRFDVRAHLDYIPPVQKTNEPPEPTQEERQCNYESFRILAQNDFLGIGEDKYLHQLHLDEQFGVNAQQLEMDKVKKKSAGSTASSGGAAIGYTYEDDSASGDHSGSAFNSASIIASAAGGNSAAADGEESDSDIDVDVSIDINKIDTQQAHELNGCGRQYGMLSNDFYSFLTKDADEAESLRMAREEEQEKIMLCGRKSRRERRAQREKRFAGRAISPPSYAAKEEPSKSIDEEKNDSDSRSPTPENTGKITYITSFGGEDELAATHSKISINFNKSARGTLGDEIAANRFGNAAKTITNESVSYADKVKQNLEKLKHLNDQPKSPRKPLAYQRRSRSRSRSRSTSRSKSYRSSRHSTSRYRPRNSSRSRSRSRSRTHSRSSSRRRRTQRRSRSRDRRRRYSTSSSSSSSSGRRSRSHRQRSLSSSSTTSSSSSSSRSSIKRRSRSISKTKNQNSSKISSVELSRAVRIGDKSSAPVQALPTITAALPAVPTTAVVAIVSTVAAASACTEATPKTTTTPQASVKPSLPVELPAISSPTKIREMPNLPEVQAPIKKYYGRKRDGESSSSDNDLSYEEAESTDKNKSDSTASTNKSVNLGKAATIHTKDAYGPSKPSLNPRDRLKKKMQILLNKQYKADKMAEIEKNERQIQQQQERDDEMREMALRLRRRQRELRHKYGGESDQSGGGNESSASNRSSVSRSARDSPKLKVRHRSRSRSRSRSYESRKDKRTKYSTQQRRRYSRERSRSRQRRSRDRSRNRSRERGRRSPSREHRSSNLNERRRHNDRPKKLVDY